MATGNRNFLITIGFYIISVSAIILINKSGQFKSGPCTPDLDILSFFILGSLSLILLIINGILAFGFKRNTQQSFNTHIVAFTIWTIYLLLKLTIQK